MNDKFAEPFIESALSVFPQLGVSGVRIGSIKELGKKIDAPGVIVILGVIGDLRGNVIYGMSEECAMKIASTMMMGMEVKKFDEMAQSAVSELSNMLTATAATELTKKGITTDISTPTLMYGAFTASASFEHVTCIETFLDDEPFYIYVSLENK